MKKLITYAILFLTLFSFQACSYIPFMKSKPKKTKEQIEKEKLTEKQKKLKEVARQSSLGTYRRKRWYDSPYVRYSGIAILGLGIGYLAAGSGSSSSGNKNTNTGHTLPNPPTVPANP